MFKIAQTDSKTNNNNKNKNNNNEMSNGEVKKFLLAYF
jgi:hypothetical protein